MYIRLFGADFRPDPYRGRVQAHPGPQVVHAGRLITVNDIYSFDPNAACQHRGLHDIIGRNFRQPEEGLGFDNSPVAHMWRAMIWPAKYL